jgi:hypothetical protein
VTRHVKILFALSGITTLASIIHWRFVIAHVEALGIPLALIPVAFLVHAVIASGFIALIVKWHRQGPGAEK